KVPESDASHHSSKDSVVFRFLDQHYTTMLRWSVDHRKTVLAVCLVTILSIVPLFMMVGKNFLPQDDQSQYNVLLRTPEGTSLAATAGIGDRMAQELRKLPGVTHTLLTVGGTADKAVNNASIYVKLADLDHREVSQQQLMQRTREMLAAFPKEIHTGVEQVNAVGGNQSNAE